MRTQSKNIDFANATSVRPFQTGTSLPGSCLTGEMFFKSDAPAGSNTYGCAAPNTWVLEGQGGTDTGTAPLPVELTSGTVLTIGPTCSPAAPCRARIGALVYSFTVPATAVVTSGTGLAYIYVNDSGSIAVGTASSNGPAVNCSGCQVFSPITQFPPDSIPLALWQATSGTWDATGVDQQALLSAGSRVLAGPNVAVAQTARSVTVSATPAGAPAELQFNDGGAFGAVASSSVTGGVVRLGASVPPAGALFSLGNSISGGNANGTAFAINTPSGYTGDLVNWMASGSSKFRINALGKTAVGTSAPPLSGSASDPDLLVQDATAATGNTQVQFQAGAGQNRDLAQWVSSAGVAGARVSKEGAVQNLPYGSQPSCSASTRGMFWHAQGGGGVKDRVEVCAKDAADAYAWRVLY